ncbi:MAG: 2,3,4,5-tetrahydropyridine-2,6-dicarboxylate N-succinyltransferase, partial [Cytophagales bacterium]|nr:2,3,4,5-tetrahydropyridine-2,6-dicarboxylate N-succinyltransferase [Cytophagales bacterium]
MAADLKEIIENAWEDKSLLKDHQTEIAIKTIIEELDKGVRRVAEKIDGEWVVNNWIKKAVILYFPLRKMQVIEIGPYEYHDKMKLKTGYEQLGVRVVPPAVARYGSFLAKGVIMMPSYV